MNTTKIESIKDDNNQKQYEEGLFDKINYIIHCLHNIQKQNENLTNRIEKIEKVINKQLINNKKSFKKQKQVNKSKEIAKDDKLKTIEKVETNAKSSSNDTKEKEKVIIVSKTIKPIKSDEKSRNKISKKLNQQKVKSTKVKINKEEKTKQTKADEKEITKQMNLKENKSTKIKINKNETETTINENKSKNYNEEKINQAIELDEEICDVEKTSIAKNSRKQRRISNRQNNISFHIGYMGEAYIYKNLIQMGCFSKVEWNANTKDENNPSVTTMDGSKYFIQEDGEHYDIYAEDFENQKYYFEIKSTNKDHKGNGISSAQKNYFLKAVQKDTYLILAKVTNVLEIPSIEYSLYVPHIGFKNIDINKEKPEKYFIKKDLSNIGEDEETDLNKINKKQSANVEKPMKIVSATLENKKIKKTTKK